MSRNRKSAKAAGARMEQAVADYLAWALNDHRVERRHLSGTKDRGDITGILLDGERVVIEVKDTARADISGHLTEARTEAGNDDAVFWAVVQKRHGIGLHSTQAIGQQLVVMTLEQYATILNHGVPLGEEMES
ncbi:hypothetical protein [Bifidobacterium mongoliense]|uniref:Endonuclease n=1 Tax=Bifidobacterium mongoliense TaxID=518643 RepID=A0A423UE24_9BIFI|nr:hypothetical protein [Bifidobacterium mongoliense]ROT86961.1 hypothetical protein BMONG18_0960 [Bifidobacterium mongoliense]